MNAHLRSVITGISTPKYALALLKQHNSDGKENGFIEIVFTETGRAPKSLGIYEDARLVEALSVYHRCAEKLQVPHAS